MDHTSSAGETQRFSIGAARRNSDAASGRLTMPRTMPYCSAVRKAADEGVRMRPGPRDFAFGATSLCASIVAVIIAVIIMEAVTAVWASGQTVPQEPGSAATRDKREAPAAGPPIRLVTNAYRLSYDDRTQSVRRAGLNDMIVIHVKGLDDLMAQAHCEDSYAKPGCQKQPVLLFLDGRPIKKLVPDSGAPRPGEGTLHFRLRRSSDSDEMWADLLGAPVLGGSGNFLERKNVEVSVGLENRYPEATEVKDFTLIRLHPVRSLIAMVGVAAIIWALLVLGPNTSLLRDGGPPLQSGNLRPYSLGRCQMALWFVLVIVSFVFIWLVTGAVDTITGSLLALIGIGTGTALGAAVIDTGKRGDQSVKHQALATESRLLAQEVTTLRTKLAAVPAPANGADTQRLLDQKIARQDEIAKEIATIDKSLVGEGAESRGFRTDILGDSGGISFHRFQIVVWTLVLTLVFVHSVWARLAMPQFSETLLALMGLSAGTYLGFKIPESRA